MRPFFVGYSTSPNCAALEFQMQRQLHEPGTAQRVLDRAAMSGRWKQVTRGCVTLKGSRRNRWIAEGRIESHVVIRRVEYLMIENIEYLSIKA